MISKWKKAVIVIAAVLLFLLCAFYLYASYAIKKYFEEEERLKPENRYEDTWIIEKRRIGGDTISFRSNGSTNVLVVTDDGEYLYRKPEHLDSADFFAFYAGIPIAIWSPEEKENRIIERVLRNAGFHSDGTNWYNTEDDKNDPSKIFDIYGNPLIPDFFKNFPNTRTEEKIFEDFFSNANKSSIFLYKKWGKEITALDNRVVELNKGKGKIIETVYMNQLVNKTKDMADEIVTMEDMCQLTSLAMFLAQNGISTEYTQRTAADELYDIAEKKGFSGSKLWKDILGVYNAVLDEKASGLKAAYINSKMDDSLKERLIIQIDKGNVSLVSTQCRHSERDCGHIVLLVGYTENGFIVHDPYGNFNKGENGSYANAKNAIDFDGSFVEYRFDSWKDDDSVFCLVTDS